MSHVRFGSAIRGRTYLCRAGAVRKLLKCGMYARVGSLTAWSAFPVRTRISLQNARRLLRKYVGAGAYWLRTQLPGIPCSDEQPKLGERTWVAVCSISF